MSTDGDAHTFPSLIAKFIKKGDGGEGQRDVAFTHCALEPCKSRDSSQILLHSTGEFCANSHVEL